MGRPRKAQGPSDADRAGAQQFLAEVDALNVAMKEYIERGQVDCDPEDFNSRAIMTLDERDLIKALAANPEVYKGTAADASKIVRLARQILAEMTA